MEGKFKLKSNIYFNKQSIQLLEQIEELIYICRKCYL